jgi:hypothetical protein
MEGPAMFQPINPFLVIVLIFFEVATIIVEYFVMSGMFEKRNVKIGEFDLFMAVAISNIVTFCIGMMLMAVIYWGRLW